MIGIGRAAPEVAPPKRTERRERREQRRSPRGAAITSTIAADDQACRKRAENGGLVRGAGRRRGRVLRQGELALDLLRVRYGLGRVTLAVALPAGGTVHDAGAVCSPLAGLGVGSTETQPSYGPM